MALGDIHLCFTLALRALGWLWWRAWTGLVAGDVALGDIHLRFAWQAWRLGHWAGSGGALGPDWSPVTPRHFEWQAWQAWHLVTSFCGAGVALRGLGWLWWRAWTGLVAGDAAALCVAGVALGDIRLRFAWQAWQLAASTFVLSHTIFVAHNFVTHHLSHTIFDTPSLTPSFTPLCHTPSLTHHFVTHHFVTHHLSHTIFHTPHCHTPSFTHRHRPSFTHTIFHTTLCLTPSFTTPSFTHHFVTHYLSPHHLSHTTLSHTIFHTQLCHTPSFTTPSFTHNFVTQLCQTLSFTHNFHTHTHTHPMFTHNFVTHNFVLLLDPSPPPLSFLPSPSPPQHLMLIIGRSCLVGLSGPLILFLCFDVAICCLYLIHTVLLASAV